VDSTQFASYEARDVGTFLEGVSGIVTGYCGWHIAPTRTDSLTLDGFGGSHLWLPSLHVTEIESLTVAGEELTSDQFDWSEDGYLELRCGRFPNRPRTIAVTMTHGYETVPADVAQVVMEVAARAKASPAGALREQAGQVSVDHGRINGGMTPGGALLSTDKERLDPY